MTDSEHPLSDDPQDGFDLIEYPCDYSFKAMCRLDEFSSIEPAEIIRTLALEHIPETSLLGVKTKQSRTGKFESVTLTVSLTSRAQLESIYQAIASSPIVVMTL